MKKQKCAVGVLLLLFLIAALASSCASPRSLAEEVAKEYVAAVVDNNLAREASLLVYGDSLQTTFDTDSVVRKCIFTKGEIAKLAYGFNANPQFLGGIYSGYEVKVSCGNKSAIIYVSKGDDGVYKIYSSRGLFTYECPNISCSTKLTYTTDQEQGQAVRRMLKDLSLFQRFSTAVADNDSVTMREIFPGLKDHKTLFKGAPEAVSYTQTDKYLPSVIVCSDSTSYKVGNDEKIEDSRGVISSQEAEAALQSIGLTPERRGNRYDIEYINALSSRYTDVMEERRREERAKAEEAERKAREIAEENERKARAAKIRAQGVALISSQMVSDGNGAKGIKYTVLNTSTKTAKYVTIEVVGYNAVDDPIMSKSGYMARCSGIGPVEPGEIYYWEFNDIWPRGDLLSSYEIKRLIIQFRDGTTKTVKLPQPLPSDWRSWLY